MTKLTLHFTLAELTRSQAAARHGIDNRPSPEQIDRLRTLCIHVLEPVRTRFGPVFVTSGFRSPRLNKLLNGAAGSQHCLGEAADIELPGMANAAVAHWIAENLTFDQLILEYYRPDDPQAGWVHVSYREGRNRRELLSYDGRSYRHGLVS